MNIRLVLNNEKVLKPAKVFNILNCFDFLISSEKCFFARNRSFLVENPIERMKKVRLKNELKRMKRSHSLIHVATSNFHTCIHFG